MVMVMVIVEKLLTKMRKLGQQGKDQGYGYRCLLW